MINSRDEPHADGAVSRRLHVIVGDTSVCQATTRLKVGATDLVLRALEQGQVPPVVALADPVGAIRQISHNFLDQRPVSLADGRTITAPDLQGLYLALAESVAEPSDEPVLDLWRRGLDAWQSLDFSKVASELDWVIKHRLISRFQSRSGLSLLDSRVRRLELAYHDVGKAGLAEKLTATGAMASVVQPQQVSQAVLRPPSLSRAQVRAAFVQAARAAQVDYLVDWTNFQVLGQQGARAKVMDPAGLDAEAAWVLVEQLKSQAVLTGPTSLDHILAQAAGQETTSTTRRAK